MNNITENVNIIDDELSIIKQHLFKSHRFHVIVAHSFPEFGIGINGKLPWNLKNDLLHFKNTTSMKWEQYSQETQQFSMNIVVFGRKTWECMNNTSRQSILANRIVIIVSNQIYSLFENRGHNEYWCSWNNLDSAILNLQHDDTLTRHVFFAGGQSIYEQAFADYPIDCVHATEVYLNKKKNKNTFDTFFPQYEPRSFIVNSHCNINPDSRHYLKVYQCSRFVNENNIWYRYKTYASYVFYSNYSRYFNNGSVIERDNNKNNATYNKNHLNYWNINSCEENDQYLKIMSDIMSSGVDRDDRTGTGTRSLFGTRQVYDLTDTFPIITTRQQWLKGIFEELKLYLSGKTDNTILQNKNIHIWDGNTSREFLDSRSLTAYPVGDMGETYGFNFRHYGGDYIDCKTEYGIGTNGYDQLSNVIELLKNDPTSRRIIINLWNPATLHKAALPSCLMMYQFYVDTTNNVLNCQIYIRSSDYFLANNWNCCTGALLVHMLCSLKDIPYTPGRLTVITGDTHIYKTHFEQVSENLSREPLPFPKLEINPEKTYTSLDDIKYEDLCLIGYQPLPSISAPMAV